MNQLYQLCVYVLVLLLCFSDHFQCDMGLCIPRHLMCDENYDCPDWSDERQTCCELQNSYVKCLFFYN